MDQPLEPTRRVLRRRGPAPTLRRWLRARISDRAVDPHTPRAGRAAHPIRSGAAGLLCHRALRAFGHADSRAGLPRGRTAGAAAPLHVRRIEQATRDVCPVAARRLVFSQTALAQPFGNAGVAARGRARESGTRCPVDSGVDPRGTRAGPADRLVPRAVLGKLGRRRPLPPPALDPPEWPRHDHPVRRAGIAAPVSQRQPGCAECAAQTVAGVARALQPRPRRGHRAGPFASAHADQHRLVPNRCAMRSPRARARRTSRPTRRARARRNSPGR